MVLRCVLINPIMDRVVLKMRRSLAIVETHGNLSSPTPFLLGPMTSMLISTTNHKASVFGLEIQSAIV